MLKSLFFNSLKLFFIFKKTAIPKNPKKILVIRMGGIGDVLMSTPLVRNLRLAYPNAQIDYLVGDWAKIALKGNRDVSRVIAYDEKVILGKKFFKIAKLTGKIRKEHYDICFILDKHWFFNLLAFFIAPFRVGFDRFGEGFCNNINMKYTGKKYELEYYLDLLRKMKILVKHEKMVIEWGDEIYARKLLKNWRKTATLIPGAAVNPGQKLLAKRWPKDSYIELGKRLLSRGYKVIIIGADTDRKICDEVESKLEGAFNLAGISIEMQVGVMKKSSYVITHDSGPMHIAAAAGARLIAIFGPTDAERFAPKNAIVLTKKPKNVRCYDVYGHYDKRCDMWTSKVTVDDVLRHIK
ncbi:MAG TPA: glycosyltransferase family 9 protein [Candidatus Nanoarchaeia archaeon]|nr:glycosyltransferase family 9 protein [Candidatus Nanoarchaeia archaeon]